VHGGKELPTCAVLEKTLGLGEKVSLGRKSPTLYEKKKGRRRGGDRGKGGFLALSGGEINLEVMADAGIHFGEREDVPTS